MYTRSSSKRPVQSPRVVYERDFRPWTVSEEREMVRLRRYEELPFANIAHTLRRSPEAIHFRFKKLIAEHVEGGHNEKEVRRWFNLSEE